MRLDISYIQYAALDLIYYNSILQTVYFHYRGVASPYYLEHETQILYWVANIPMRPKEI